MEPLEKIEPIASVVNQPHQFSYENGIYVTKVEPGRAEPPATSAVPHRYDHRAGLPHDADGGSSDISAHDYHQ